ncbi:unnamed protein product [Ectocarpus sp. 12 AP-2014]
MGQSIINLDQQRSSDTHPPTYTEDSRCRKVFTPVPNKKLTQLRGFLVKRNAPRKKREFLVTKIAPQMEKTKAHGQRETENTQNPRNTTDCPEKQVPPSPSTSLATANTLPVFATECPRCSKHSARALWYMLYMPVREEHKEHTSTKTRTRHRTQVHTKTGRGRHGSICYDYSTSRVCRLPPT